MKAIITDVAKQAGVSMKTVSRVLNNEPNVAKATRDRVMEVAATLQYRPNLAARGLASSKSYLIALLYDNASASYITNIQRGAIEACRQNGYHLLLEPMPYEQANSPEAETLLRRLGVDGVILTPPLSDSLVLRESLCRLNMRHVAVAPNKLEEVYAVRMDDVEAAFQMTSYLIEQGHRDIGFILGHPDHGAMALRRNGFEKALKQAGIPLNEDRVIAGDFSFRSGVEAAEKLLNDPTHRPTAIFASNDDMAAGVISVAGRLSISVPEELSVSGFDDTPIAQIIWPQLTTIAQPIHRMGFKAANILIKRDNPDEPKICTLDFELVIRDSTLGGPTSG